MSNDQPAPRRPPAKTGGGAPMGSTISIVIAVVAVVVGFLILRNINDDGSSGASIDLPDITLPGTSDTAEIVPGTDDIAAATTLPINTTPATTPLVFSPGKVVVANASGIGGAAGAATKALSNLGFTMGDPTDAFGPEKKITTTKVYYQVGSELVAASVAQAFSSAESVIATAAMPTPIPVTNATIGDSTILVMLGTDLANLPLPILSASTTTVAAAVDPAATTTLAG